MDQQRVYGTLDGLLGTTLLTMVNNENETTTSGSGRNTTETPKGVEWKYDWDKMTQGMVVSSFFAGSYVMQFAVGWLANRFGGKRVVCFGTVSLALCQLVAIAAATQGPVHLSVTMTTAGLAHALIMAAVVAVLGRWVPRHESSQLSSIAQSGSGPGTALVYGVSAVTSRVQFIGGWPFNFITLDSPETNTRISAEERTYIRSSLQSRGHKHSSIPWRKILTSPPFFAVACAQLGSDWMFFSLITVIPGYFKRVRHMETHQVDLLCGLPWLAVPFVAYAISKAVDTLRKRGVPTTLLRKTSDALAKPAASGLLVVMSFLPTGYTVWVVVLYTTSVLLLAGFAQSSHNTSVVEMSPEFAGVVYGLSQVFAMTGAFTAPLLFEYLTPHDSPEEWRLCYGILFGIALVTFAVFALLGSSERQHWAPDDTDTQGLM
ncbi:hypothetical protein BaRGS_00008967 [Batillaria attramentaria]|uniref:Uncharacterized protein n=1 Tax=Batillaria attramentaria TaxID=370345 RepID=A0ABD0LKX1_9CAEN